MRTLNEDAIEYDSGRLFRDEPSYNLGPELETPLKLLSKALNFIYCHV